MAITAAIVLPPGLTWTLEIGSGILWTLAYILIIRLGFREKTYGMPIAALCANISWEFIFSFIYHHEPPQNYVNVVWFIFDLVIVCQALRYGKAELARSLPVGWFYPIFLLTLLLSFAGILAITVEFKDYDGKYAAFGQNLMMSILFIAMLVRRNHIRGQSIYIAFFKMIGTLLPSILFYLRYPGSVLLNFLYVAIFIFDAAYLILLYEKHREMGVDPWRRA